MIASHRSHQVVAPSGEELMDRRQGGASDQEQPGYLNL